MPPSQQPSSLARDQKPQLSIGAILGLLCLVGDASRYAAYGWWAYPRQEWLVETLVAAIFVIPAVNLLHGGGRLSSAVRVAGLMLLMHSVWDALHFPGISLIHTPVDPKIPWACPFVDVPLGFYLLIRGS